MNKTAVEYDQEKPYTSFASVYNATMKQVPYIKWTSYIINTLLNYGCTRDSLLLDVGCGTGLALRNVQAYFPRAIGIDSSYSMLNLSVKDYQASVLQADMMHTPFADESIHAAFCIHDCLNYLMTEENLKVHFEEMARVLKPGSLYIFDVSTEYNVVNNYHETTFREVHGNTFFEWKNVYDKEKRIITSTLDFFPVKSPLLWKLIGKFLPKLFLRNNPANHEVDDSSSNGNSKGKANSTTFKENVAKRSLKTKKREVHIQKIFTDSSIENALGESGFVIVEKSQDYTEGYTGVSDANLMVYVAQLSG